MLSWNDGNERSSGSLLSEFDFDYSHPDVPETIYDPNWEGVASERKEPCNHGSKLRKYVAFQGTNTGRRFFGCANEEGPVCETVEWVDREWPDSLQKCLVKLWELYEIESTGRITDSCDATKKYYRLSKENKELEEINKKLQVELNNQINDSQMRTISQNHLHTYTQVAEAEGREAEGSAEGGEEKLEYYIVDLLKAGEVNKHKLQKLKDILHE